MSAEKNMSVSMPTWYNDLIKIRDLANRHIGELESDQNYPYKNHVHEILELANIMDGWQSHFVDYLD